MLFYYVLFYYWDVKSHSLVGRHTDVSDRPIASVFWVIRCSSTFFQNR